MLAVVALSAAACSSGPLDASGPARTHQPAAAVSVLSGTPQAVAAGVAAGLFASAPDVAVASASGGGDLTSAVGWAGRAHVPLLLTPAPGGPKAEAAALRTELAALHCRNVLAAGDARNGLTGLPAGVHVMTSATGLHPGHAPAPLDRVVLLVHRGDASAAARAAIATAHAAGARVITTASYDPRADPAAVTALAAAKPQRVLAVGSGFGPVSRLTARLAVAATGVQLPGGGQVLFPMRRLVALYGHPGAPTLGALGEQGLAASIARARRVAQPYRRLSHMPVIPAFEIIASVAEAHAGPDGSYSYETPLAQLRPWVRRATAAGLYVVLDLQPGRASLLTQARYYAPLLRSPDVGLALDAEWKLAPGQLPLQQIGSVNATEINSVGRWLDALTARYRLPQKLLVLHQFRLSMISDENRLDTRYDDLAVVIHMDGQGSPTEKEETWRAVTAAAPRGVFFGWKDFYTKDHPTLTPRQTMAAATRPAPVMISYQ